MTNNDIIVTFSKVSNKCLDQYCMYKLNKQLNYCRETKSVKSCRKWNRPYVKFYYWSL